MGDETFPQVVGKKVEIAAGSANFWCIQLDCIVRKGGAVEHHDSLNHGVFFMTEEEANKEESLQKFVDALMRSLEIRGLVEPVAGRERAQPEGWSAETLSAHGRGPAPAAVPAPASELSVADQLRLKHEQEQAEFSRRLVQQQEGAPAPAPAHSPAAGSAMSAVDQLRRGEQDGWTCSFCSFRNHIALQRCEMCGKDPDGYPQIIGKKVEQSGGNSWAIVLDCKLTKGGRVENRSSLNHGIVFTSEQEADSEMGCKKFLDTLMDSLTQLKEEANTSLGSATVLSLVSEPAQNTMDMDEVCAFLLQQFPGGAVRELLAEDPAAFGRQREAITRLSDFHHRIEWANKCGKLKAQSSIADVGKEIRQVFMELDPPLDFAGVSSTGGKQEAFRTAWCNFAASWETLLAGGASDSAVSDSGTTTQFAHKVGFLADSRGRYDLHKEDSMTIGQAKAWAAAHPECAGFTYASADPEPQGPIGQVFFKSRAGDEEFCAMDGWSAWFVARPDPALAAGAQATLPLESENDVAAQLMRKHEEEQRRYKLEQEARNGDEDDDPATRIAEQMRLRYEREQEEFAKKYGPQQQ